jgi:hypothetical protein
MKKSFFLSFNTDSFSSSTGGFGVLTSDFKSPFVSDTFVASDFVQSFDIFSEFGLKNVGSDLEVLSFFVIFLSVEEPSWDTVSFRIIDDVGNTVTLGFGEFTSSESWVDSEDFTDKESESSSDTFDFIKSVRNGSFTINVGVKNTVDMLEVSISVFNDE